MFTNAAGKPQYGHFFDSFLELLEKVISGVIVKGCFWTCQNCLFKLLGLLQCYTKRLLSCVAPQRADVKIFENWIKHSWWSLMFVNLLPTAV